MRKQPQGNSPPFPGQLSRSETVVPIWLCVLALGVFWTYLGGQNWIHTFYDYPGYVGRAEEIGWSQPETFHNLIKPLGYPALIRAANMIFRDYRITGVAVSVLSGVLCIIALEELWRRFGLGVRTRVAVMLLVGLSQLFTHAAFTPGTDMLNMAFATMACLPLCKSRWRGRDAFMTGIIVGIGVLNRQRLAFFLLAPLIRTLFSGERVRSKLKQILLLGFGFFLFASAQLWVNTAATGNPFGQNPGLAVDFLNRTDWDFVDTWLLWLRGRHPRTSGAGLWLFSAFWKNLYRWTVSFQDTFPAWGLFLVPGLISVLRGSSGWTPVRSYVLANAVLFASVCLIPPQQRFALFLVPPIVLFSVWFFIREVIPAMPARLRSRRWLMPTALAVAVGCLAFHDIYPYRKMSPLASQNLEVELLMQRLRVNPRRSLLQIGCWYYRCTHPVPEFYQLHGGYPRSYQLTVESLKDVLFHRRCRYVLIGTVSGGWPSPDLIVLMDPNFEDLQLEPIRIWTTFPQAALYRCRHERRR